MIFAEPQSSLRSFRWIEHHRLVNATIPARHQRNADLHCRTVDKKQIGAFVDPAKAARQHGLGHAKMSSQRSALIQAVVGLSGTPSSEVTLSTHSSAPL